MMERVLKVWIQLPLRILMLLVQLTVLSIQLSQLELELLILQKDHI